MAALPNFRKLYRRIIDEDLINGQYALLIDYNYPVSNFNGKKRAVLSTVSWQGMLHPKWGAPGACVYPNSQACIFCRI